MGMFQNLLLFFYVVEILLPIYAERSILDDPV